MSTSRDDDVPDCALCERKATSRCSACKNIWFCSAQCQATLWPVHKSLCQADQAIFRQAPLTKQELADFKVLSDGMYQFGRGAPPGYDNVMPVRQVMQAATSLEDWSDVLDLLVTPTTAPTPAHEVDDVRKDAITMARIQLANLYDPPDDDDDDKPVTSVPPSMPWIQMAHCMTLAGVAYGFVIAQDDEAVHGTARLIKELNAFLRQTLIQCTVDYHVMKMTSIPQVTPWLPLLYLARDRAIAALDRSNIDPRIVAQLRPPLLAKYEDVRYLAQREDGTMPPAVHP